jgi:hypothetical protein
MLLSVSAEDARLRVGQAPRGSDFFSEEKQTV